MMKTAEQPDKLLLSFLKSLSKNNEREWFGKNRNIYEPLKKSFEVFIQDLIGEIAEFDPIVKGLEAKSCIFRINRDTRFSNDKSPYKTNFGAFIVRGGRKNGDRFPGYYIHIEPGKSMIAGGAYMPPSPWLIEIRQKISENPGEWFKIISDKNFKKYFGTVEGEKLKTVPKGFDKDNPMLPYLRHKSFIVINSLSDSEVTDQNFKNHAIQVCMAMKPFNDFLLTSY